MACRIDRGFVRLAEGLVHYRSAGERSPVTRPLYMAHAGPGSSLGLVPLMAELGEGRFVIAPDMLGNGDSDPPGRTDGDIGYYADCAIRTLDALGIEQVDFYGSHTGAMIGVELARSHPDRVAKLILDGVVLMDAAERRRMLDSYAPAMLPDDHGGQLAWAYQFCRDMFLFYPYFDRDPAHRTATGVPSAAVLHAFVVDVLKALTTYHHAYRAAFGFDMVAALTSSCHPLLLTASANDPTHGDLWAAKALRRDADAQIWPSEMRSHEIAKCLSVFLLSQD